MAGERASASPVLRVSGLRRDFGDLTAVDGFDLDLAAGECVSLIGHNGSGKTTALRVAAGQLVPTSGTVTVGGADVHDRWHGHVALARLAFVPDTPEYPDTQHFSLFPARSRLGRREFIEPHNPFALR